MDRISILFLELAKNSNNFATMVANFLKKYQWVTLIPDDFRESEFKIFFNHVDEISEKGQWDSLIFSDFRVSKFKIFFNHGEEKVAETLFLDHFRSSRFKTFIDQL